MRLQINKLKVVINNHVIINSLDFDIKGNKLIGLIGPNGSGKTTFLRTIYNYLKPKSGTIYLDNQIITEMTVNELAKKIAVVKQERESSGDFTVFEYVSFGRSPYKNLMERMSYEDIRIIKLSLNKVGIDKLSDRYLSSLSGGEKQRVVIARAIAQQSSILLLDEPTNHLDPKYQIEVMELVKSLDCLCIVVMHDLNLASMYCDKLFLINKGKIVIGGKPDKVLTVENISKVYGIKCKVEKLNGTKYPQLFFLKNSK